MNEMTMHRRVLHYDARRRRLWVLGQRCHHGAGGGVLLAAAGVAARNLGSSALVALGATGGLLMAHDWSDRSIWFERGAGSQP